VSQLDAEGVRAFIESVWPGAFEMYEILELQERHAVVKMTHHERMLRPGGTVSGPALMALADLAVWVAVIAVVGPIAMTVTTHLDIDFLRFVGAHDVVADTRLLKVGRSLAVADVLMTAEGAIEPCAHASVTYAIPPS
jgi:uncharacterized protein (TIGR00369 family)